MFINVQFIFGNINKIFLIFCLCEIKMIFSDFQSPDAYLQSLHQRYAAAKYDSECNCVCGLNGRQMRIVGGEISQVHEFPWMAGISRNGKLFCGASLLTRRHVLTAAHCIDGYPLEGLQISLGKHYVQSDKNDVGSIEVDEYLDDKSTPNTFRISASIQRKIKAVSTHPDFNIFNFHNDIAIVELDEPVEFSDILQPVCLPSPSQNYTSRLGLVIGWGRTTEDSSPSSFLRKAFVPIWSTEQCKDAGYGRRKITDDMICAGFHDGGRDACQGDSGGPLHLHGSSGSMEIVGLVSWGRGCARPNYPGIYTRVESFLDWIHKSLDGECLCSPIHSLDDED